jgi:tyrosyl-tRNA synthetase
VGERFAQRVFFVAVMAGATRAMTCHRLCLLSHPSELVIGTAKTFFTVQSFQANFFRKWSSIGSIRAFGCGGAGASRACPDGILRIPNYDSLPQLPSFRFSALDKRARGLCDLHLARAQVSVEERQIETEYVSRNVVDILQERGLIESITDEELRSVCTKKRLKVYCGFDPTAESLHLGNLLAIIVLSWFQRCGHIPVALLGGATARVGDPSGKSMERPVMDDQTITRNLKGIHGVLSQILKVEDVSGDKSTGGLLSAEGASGINRSEQLTREKHSPLILNNYDWWKEFSLLNFLRDVGKYARVGTMMAKESVKKRLNSEEGMSYTEFTYQLLQGYDFVHLFKEEGISVQIGGSDQWGNITAGTDLVRKLLQQEGAYGLTFPLLLKSDGSKFGKSVGGAIWLSRSLLSPYKFYQYLFATPDSDVIKFMKILTFLDLEEIQSLEATMGKEGYVPNSVQRRLAEEVTLFVHGEEGLTEALNATQALAPGGATQLDWKTLEAITEDVPSCSVAQASLLGSSLVDLCVSTGLLQSKTAVRRMIKQGGLYLNNEKVEDEGKTMVADDIVDGKMLLLSAGKKNKIVVRMT